jgi:cytidylate kinase
MILTIDGPAGTGKSSVSRQVARRLGFDFLDTGAMYRAIALEALRRQADWEDPRGLAFIARHCRIDFDWPADPPGVTLNGEPVGHLLRGGEVTKAASHVAVVPAIRQQLVEQQRRIGAERTHLVTEGRDQGSVVFPHAELKVYLDAAPGERARRRVQQLRARGEIVDPAEILRQLEARDARDKNRAVGPLVIPAGAVVIDTTDLDEPQVIERIIAEAQRVRGGQ